jgi:hypothetical protein
MGWVEVLAVLLVIGFAAGVVVARAQEARERGVAADLRQDFNTLRQAAFDYRAANGSWPPDAATGEMPPGLEAFLPAGFQLTREHYRFDWEYWRLPDGLPRHPGIQELVGISVITELPRVGVALGEALGPAVTWYALDDRFTYIIEGL